MKSVVTTFALLHIFCITNAQTKPVKNKLNFQSILQAGLLAGNTTSAYEVQSISGVKYKQLFAGAGIGIDNYVYRTIPVFADVRFDVLQKRNTPYVFANAGSQFCWLQHDQKAISYFNPSYKAGLYFNAGAGYKIYLFSKNAIVFSAAFSLKKITETEQPYCYFAACPEQKPLINNYTFRRLSLMLGWTIW